MNLWRRKRPRRGRGRQGSLTATVLWPFQYRTAARVARETDPVLQHELLEDILEKSKFNWRVFLVASSGFFTDSYNLFASNVILPSLAYVYLGKTDRSSELIINALTLAGSACGQVGFGIMADVWGRQRLYGVELVIVIFSTLGLAASGPGFVAGNGDRSMHALKWVMFYRFVMGVGIGAEYPLSACITAEWASKKYRSQMLSAVFMMQPIGQLIAYVVGLAVLYALDAPYGLRSLEYTDRSRIGIDILWRIVAGVGGVPALIALIFRWTIPESPRYTEEIKQNSTEAAWDAADGFSFRDPWSRAHSDDDLAETGAGGAANGNIEMGALPNQRDFANRQVTAQATSNENRTGPQTAPNSAQAQNDAGLDQEADEIPQLDNGDDDEPWTQFTRKRWNQYFHDGRGQEGNWRHIFGVSICWAFLDTVFYGLGFNDPGTLARLWTTHTSDLKPSKTPSWLLYSSADKDESIFYVLKHNGIECLVTVSIWALLGCIFLTNRINFINRRTTLIWTSTLVSLLLLILAIVFPYCFHERGSNIVLIVLYAAIQFWLSYGPNTLLFVIASEIFPTRYRCTCYGIAAASGKAGAALMQLTYHYFDHKRLRDMNSLSLGYLMYLFAGCMLVVAVAGWIYIPEVQIDDDSPKEKAKTCVRSFWVENKTLEDLGKGRAAVDDSKKVGCVERVAAARKLMRERFKSRS